VREAGYALFRRPLVTREEVAFTALYQAVLDEEVTDREAQTAVVEAMLQSPQFLYLLEVERADFVGLRAVGGHEMASRLSYLLWASAPDAALYEAAERGELDEPAGILRQVDRLLEDDAKVARVYERFILDWARMESIPDEDGRRDELLASAAAFYVDHLSEGQSLFELLTTERALLTPALAEGLGLTPAGDGIRAYDLSAAAGRVGILAQPGVVAGMTNADGGAIVARGLFLQAQLFCGTLPDPPASLQDSIDAFVAAQPPDASERAIADARLERGECASCHAHFDPLAYGLSQLDYRGRFLTEDEHGNTLRTDGWVPESLADGEAVAYGTLDEYVAALATNARVRQCLTKRHVEHAIGSRLDAEHASSIAELTTSLEATGGSHAALVRTLVVHDLFRLQPVE
jgi:hypothetical protein